MTGSNVSVSGTLPGDEITSSRLWNSDLAPATERPYTAYSLVAMWMSDVHSIGGYTFAAGLFFLGLAAWQVFVALIVGIVLVFFGMNLVGRAGTQTGVPYPVLARLSFGLFGANVPALVRAIIGIAFYGIQTYLASVALQVLGLALFPSAIKGLTEHGFLGLSAFGYICFFILWALQLVLFQRGMNTVRKFADWAGPVIWVVMIGLTIAIVVAAHGHLRWKISNVHVSSGHAVLEFFSAIALTLAYFSALLLNFCDFSRFAPSIRAVRTGNFWGLPVNFSAFALVSVTVTAGSLAVYGKAITDPVLLVAQVHSKAILILAAITFTVATIGINVVANFVSPAFDIANLWPARVSFRTGGFITAGLALVVMPWKIYSTPVIINYFLGTLGAFLGPLYGILMLDYYITRRQVVIAEDLYRPEPGGAYYYRKGVNPNAIGAFVPSAAITAVIALVPAFKTEAPFSWVIGAALGAGLYLAITRIRGSGAPASAPALAAVPEPDQ
jgi:NCS1 family nucleobase:cation symporter-1